MSTEKRLFLFLVLTFMVFAGYTAIIDTFGPKRPVADATKLDQKENKDGKGAEGGTKDADSKTDNAADEKKTDKSSDANASKTADAPAVDTPPAEAPTHPHLVLTVGNYNPPAGGNPLLLTFNSRGGALERVELVGRKKNGELRYRDLDHTDGYLGNLSLTPERGGGCRIHSVAPGTPADTAKPADASAGIGLKPNDILTHVNGRAVSVPEELDLHLKDSKRNDTVQVKVRRSVGDQIQNLQYTVILDVRPFQLIKPEPLAKGETKAHPGSLLVAVQGGGIDQEQFLNRLANVDWQTKTIEGPKSGVEFRYRIEAAVAKEFGLAGPVEVIKRFTAAPPVASPAADSAVTAPAYHIEFELELKNVGTASQTVAYRLDGTNGLPTEGWWYLTKIHPEWFASAGARDVVFATEADGHRLLGSSKILSRFKKEEKAPQTPLFSEKEPAGNRSLAYIGIDTQYFAAALLPIGEKQSRVEFARAEALVWGDPTKIPKGWERTANTSYQLTSSPISLEPDQVATQRFRLFLGPKDPEVLAAYGLRDWIYYGWFGWIARLLSSVLHFFYAIVGNYGVAIVLLTVLVRSCMFPISRTAARNAAMMQELAPEMRKIAEKHKNNLEARGKAQQELFRAHNYNPLSGCWLMFLQLPVFIGLYRCLAIDIELRQAPLIPGIEWCSNLAGPDKLFYWKTDFLSYFTDESGWLGPYFNLLPIFTIILFLLHQKLFTPPATDEQTEMQMKMMKFMTIFMGILFYKVPAGLCLYFITSSLWGIAERKLLPKPTPKKRDISPDSGGGGQGGGGFNFASLLKPRTPPPTGNGTDRKKELERKMRKK